MAAIRSQKLTENMDKKLDFLSPKFDPLKALYAENLQPPVPKIHVFNNLAEYAQAIKEGKIKSSESSKSAKGKASLRKTATRTRNLKPEYKPKEKEDVQERLKSIAESNASSMAKSKTGKKMEGRVVESKLQEFIMAEEAFKAEQIKKKRMNVIDRMEACTEGPFSILHTCLTKRLRVKVWTRRYKGLRGVLAGYLVAFDKHMNLALFDVDEVYTLEERTEQLQANEETQGTGKKKKKKRKKVNCQNENKPPHEEQNDEINHQNSASTSLDEVGRSSRQVTGCEGKTAGMDVEGSVKCESLAVQPSIDAQTGEGTIAPYKDSSVLDFDTLGDHGQQDISIDTPDEDSLTPSAEALSAALHASALSLDDSDGRSLLTVDQTDEFSSERCGNNFTQKPSIELLEKNESASTVTELKLTLSVCTTDCNSEGFGDYNPSSAASNIGVVDSKDTTGSQLGKLCKDKNKQVSDSSDREMDSRGEKNIDKTDFDPFPSNIVNSDVSFVGVDEILPSATEGSSHSVVSDGKENACYDRLQGNSCRINMKNNSDDFTVGDRLLVKDEEDIVMNEQKQEFTKMEHNDQLYNLIREDCSKENREIGQNTESPSNSGTTLQTVSIFSESKPVMTKDSEKKEEKCDFIEGGLLPDKSDSTEEIALVDSEKEKFEDDTTEGGKVAYLEHSTIREERPSTQGFKPHSVTVPWSVLNETQQVEHKSVESSIEVVQNEDQTQNVRFNALLLGGSCDEEKSLSNLHEVTLKLTVDSDTCDDIQRSLKLFCTDNKTDSSCGALTFSSENPPFRNEEGVVSSLICVDSTSEIEGEPTLDRAAARTSVASHQLKNSPDEALKIPLTVTNNVDMQDEENRLFDFETPEVANYVPDENGINFERQHKEAETVLIDVESAALLSNSDEILSQGGSLRSGVDSEGLYLGSSDCDQTTVENSSGVYIIEPRGNVDELPDDRKSEILHSAQSEPSCGDVKVATLYSDTIEASDMSFNLGMTQERNSLRTMAFDASGDRDSVTMSPEGSMESAFNNPLKVPDKENNEKNEQFSEFFKNHTNLSEMKTEDDYPSVGGTCGDCRKVTVTQDTKLQNDELRQNTVFVTKDKASEVEKEEGQISSDEVDMSEAKSRETEEEKTSNAQKTQSEDNVETPKTKSKETLENEKLGEEEKEEGELSSSDSDAEVFVKIADAQKGGPSTSKSKLFDDRMVASAVDKQLHPARRHSSGEGHHTFTMERSRLLASLGGKRRGPSSAIANADLRTRLSEILSQRTSCGNAKSGAPRFEESVKECDGTEKRSKKVKEKVPHRGKNGKGKVKGGRKVDVKDSRLKTREAQNNSTKTGSVKEDNHLGGLPKKEQLRQTPQSSKKAPQNSQGSSPCNTNSKTENTRGNKADLHPDNLQRTAAESDGKNRLKISQPESRRKTKGTRKTSTRSEDSAAVVTKDVKKDSTGRHTPNSHPDMAKKSTSKNALKTTQPESCPKTLNAESNSSDTKKTDLKGKTGGRTLRSSGTPKSASGSSVERPSKRHSMNKATLKDQPTLVGHPLSTGKGTLKGCRQVDRSCGRQTTSESKKLFNVKGGKRLAATDGNVSKVEYNEKGELQSVNVPSRTVPRKVSNKRLVNVTSKEKANPERGMEIRPQNPRKRRRSVDSTEINHGKKIRIDEVKDSLPKPSTVSSTHKLPKDSKRIPDYTSNSINVPSCGDINVEGSRKVPANMENFKQTVKPKRDGDSKADDDIQAKTISIGRNKCLVFKRRHVNQLFVRGDNVAMVAYAK